MVPPLSPAAPSLSLTVAIPTYGRDQVLVDSLVYLLDEEPPATEILVLDQTPAHAPEVALARLQEWDAAGQIRWIRLPEPSIPGSMNRGLVEARGDLV